MRLEDLDEFIDDWGLLLDCEQRAGIYCITVDMKIVYVGKSKMSSSVAVPIYITYRMQCLIRKRNIYYCYLRFLEDIGLTASLYSIVIQTV